MNRNTHLKSFLDYRTAESQDARLKWKRDNPGKEPGYSSRTWASSSKIRYPSESFRRGYDDIIWTAIQG